MTIAFNTDLRRGCWDLKTDEVEDRDILLQNGQYMRLWIYAKENQESQDIEKGVLYLN